VVVNGCRKAPVRGYNGSVILSRLIATLTIGAAGVTAGGLLISGGHELLGLGLDVLAVSMMRLAVEAHPAA
jgi:hypothetical protein